VRYSAWLLSTVAAVVLAAFGLDLQAGIAFGVSVLVRQLAVSDARARLVSGLSAIGLAAVATAIAGSTHEPETIIAAAGIAFALLVREYGNLVAAEPPGARPVLLEGGVVAFLVHGRPFGLLAGIAVLALAWALAGAVAGGIAAARRDKPGAPRTQILHGRARWSRLGDGLRAARDAAFWGLVIARPAARALLYPLAEVRWLTPNLVTAISIACCAAATVLIATGTATVLAIVLVFARSVLDSMDGQLARYREAGSQLGSFVDKVSDQFCWGALYAALAIRAFEATGSRAMLLLPLAAGLFLALSSMALWLARALAPAAPLSTGAPPAPWARNLWRIVLFEEPDFYLWISLAVITERYDIFVPLIVAGHAARALVLALARAGGVVTASVRKEASA
jgi:phosphatidylglycerophosphate synthase